MTPETPGLDDEARHTIHGLLTLCLGALPRSTTGREEAVASWWRLWSDVLWTYGWPGMYELAVHAAHILTAPLGPVGEYVSNTKRADGDAMGRAVFEAFVNAAVRDDHDTAQNVFRAVQPDQDQDTRPTGDMLGLLGSLLNVAWKRQDGVPLDTFVATGTRWPPMCDFCCANTAVGCYHCTPFSLRTSEKTRVVFEEDDIWYACGGCAADLDHAAGPRWGPVRARFLASQGSPGPGAADTTTSVQEAWNLFQGRRINQKVAPLPSGRQRSGPANLNR